MHQKCACTRSHLAQIQQSLNRQPGLWNRSAFCVKAIGFQNCFGRWWVARSSEALAIALASIRHPSCMHATTTTLRLLTTTMTGFFLSQQNIENDNSLQFALTKCMIVHFDY